MTSPYFLVLGYGSGGSLRYLRYLDRVAALYRERQPPWIVLTGGVTGKPEASFSEAEWMARQLEARGVPRDCFRLEEVSRTTVENFLRAQELGLLPHGHRAVVFGDAYRQLKIRELARQLRLDVLDFVLLPIESRPRGVAIFLKSAFEAVRWRLLGLPRS